MDIHEYQIFNFNQLELSFSGHLNVSLSFHNNSAIIKRVSLLTRCFYSILVKS